MHFLYLCTGYIGLFCIFLTSAWNNIANCRYVCYHTYARRQCWQRTLKPDFALVRGDYRVRLAPKGSQPLAEVRPRHAGFYRRTMGYRIAGAERICPRVSAPAVLLRLDFAGSQIRRLVGTYTRRDRNLYRLFLPAAGQEALLNKLAAS